MEKFCYYFLLYFIYCVFGYILECIYCSIIDKKINLNRGFLLGPYLPIYGCGAMAIIFLLKKYVDDPIVLFVMGALVATVLEYITSYIMEEIFKARWWDYSDQKFNINGRVCLLNSFLFGIGGLLIMYFVNPMFTSFLDRFNKFLLILIAIILFLTYIADTVISVFTIYKLRVNSISINKDLSEEISEQVRKIILKNKYFKKRMLGAFPSVKHNRTYSKLKEILEKHSK